MQNVQYDLRWTRFICKRYEIYSFVTYNAGRWSNAFSYSLFICVVKNTNVMHDCNMNIWALNIAYSYFNFWKIMYFHVCLLYIQRTKKHLYKHTYIYTLFAHQSFLICHLHTMKVEYVQWAYFAASNFGV